MANIVGTYTADVATITAGKQLGFKLGLESKLTNASFTAQDGVFYLTSDTHRLFIGNKEGNVCPVNQGVIHVDSVPDATNAIPGQFYYVDTSNILATYNGSRWVQINPDTYVDSVSETVTGGTNTAKVTTSVKHGGGKANTVTSAGFTVKGGGNNVVTVSGSEITVTDADFNMSTSGDANGVDINLTKKAAGATTYTNYDKVTIKTANGIAISQANDVITLDGEALVNANSNNAIKSAVFSNEAQGFKLTLTKGNNSTLTPTVDPIIHYGSNNTPAHFVNGIADLDVYTTGETDDKIAAALQSFNALMYKGTVGGGTTGGGHLDDLKNATDVKNGDVYMATGSGTITIGGVAKSYDAGTLFIACGTENSSGVIPAANIEWTIVQNFNTDTQTQVDLIDNGIKLSNKAGAKVDEIGGITVKSSTTDILTVTAKASTDGSKKIQNLTVAHGSSNYTPVNADAYTTNAAKDLLAKKVLTGVGADAYGHLKSSTEEWIKVPTEIFKETTIAESVAVNGTVATLSHSLTLKNSSSNADISTATISTKIASDTLEIKESSTNSGILAMNLIWGQF